MPAGVTQGARSGPWLFLAMINNFKIQRDDISLRKFADDTSVGIAS